jgi:hypothetical protein
LGVPQADSPSSSATDAAPGAGRRWFFAAILIVLPLAVLALAEGSASLLLFVSALRHSRSSDARSHTAYDSLLGWSSTKGLSWPNYYGPGGALHINRLGFREASASGPRVPGSRRLVCLGDSFTFGHGVADSATWCARLSEQDNSLQTINMGQVGFGLDQDYLWFRRDGAALDPDVLVMAFVKADFNRTRLHEFLGYPKPWLAVDHDSLITRGFPVPRLGAMRLLMLRVGPALQGLRLSQLAIALKGGKRTDMEEATAGDSATAGEVGRILASLAAWQHSHGHRFIAVLIPAESDYLGLNVGGWRDLLKADAATGHYEFIDLVGDLRRLPSDSVPPLYIHESDGIPHHAEGHLTVRGNRWVAQRLLEQLRAGAPARQAARGRRVVACGSEWMPAAGPMSAATAASPASCSAPWCTPLPPITSSASPMPPWRIAGTSTRLTWSWCRYPSRRRRPPRPAPTAAAAPATFSASAGPYGGNRSTSSSPPASTRISRCRHACVPW